MLYTIEWLIASTSQPIRLIYSQQWDFWQGAVIMKQPECINIHEDCDPRDDNVKCEEYQGVNLCPTF